MKAITYILLGIVAVLLLQCVMACNPQKRWSNKGHRRGWIDTATVKVYDTLHFYGSSKDTLFLHSKDSIFLRDKLFTTVYYHDTITNKTYLRTIVNPRDTVIIKEVHTTKVQETEYSVWDHFRALWWFPLALIVLAVILFIVIKSIK